MKRLALVLLLVGVCVFVALLWASRRSGDVEAPPGIREVTGLLAPELEREFERIATVGYVAGVDEPSGDVGVLTYDHAATYDGLTLFTFGKGPEALLIDMQGRVVHRWSAEGSEYWARAHAFPNGDLLAITCFPPRLIKLDRSSEPIWRYEGHAHHDLDVQPDGTILVLVRSVATREHILDGAEVLDDNIVLLDAEGREFYTVSLLSAFERAESFSSWLTDHPLPDDPDIFHANSVELVTLNGQKCALVSIRSIDTIAAIEISSGSVVWAVTGDWHAQHEAQLVGGNLLMFDNLGPEPGPGGTRRSRVVEYDMRTGRSVWTYSEPGFFSHGAGAQQRLPNGNTLITESDAGRVIEVSPDGQVVWEYVNPRTVVESGREVTLAIMRAERLPGDFPLDWLP